MSLLCTTDLKVSRGGYTVLEGLNFALEKAEILVLRGPNGSGKTTLLRTLAGLQSPMSGEVMCQPDSIAYGAHADGVKSTLTVVENLTFWARVYDQKDITPALKAFDLEYLQDRPAGNLSAGQKRRLGLARLIVMQRPIWVLDEPTVSLDAASVQLFSDAVNVHIATGGAAIIATHIDLGFEAKIFDVSAFKPKQEGIQDAFDEAFL